MIGFVYGNDTNYTYSPLYILSSSHPGRNDVRPNFLINLKNAGASKNTLNARKFTGTLKMQEMGYNRQQKPISSALCRIKISPQSCEILCSV